MAGLAGDDVYKVNGTLDVIEEALNAGTDRVESRSTYTLSANVENLTLTGATNIIGTGNALANTIIGNTGQNKLFGSDGSDKLDGGLGNDTLSGGNQNDSLLGGGGSDSIAGGNSNDTLRAGSGNDTLDGSSHDDFLDGGSGRDQLTGGSGKDTFAFVSALGTSNFDTVTDFVAANDTIRLDSDIFTALTTTGTLASGAFRANTSGNAQDSSDHIIYETDTGRLYYDADGTGATARIPFAVLQTKPAITHADFTIV
jgi:Ca2+-binding RTX toxin-like protein